MSQLSKELDMNGTQRNWVGCDVFLPFLERIKAEKSTVVIKLDGLRKLEQDEAPYTVVISAGGLGEDFIRIDAQSIEDALAYAVINYAHRCWSFNADSDKIS
jgi:hypothetical protein